MGLIISPFFFPGILYGLPRVEQPENNWDQTPSPSFIPAQEMKETRKPAATFESEYLATIRVKVLRCMEEEKPYLHEGCNIAFLSRMINIPVHHLAYFFREEIRQSFNDFRNEWRVNHAKNMIINGSAREMTLEAIGLSSGFSSRITFINAFKKAEGVPPGFYASKVNPNSE